LTDAADAADESDAAYAAVAMLAVRPFSSWAAVLPCSCMLFVMSVCFTTVRLRQLAPSEHSQSFVMKPLSF
jgi:hypothetical protein